MIDISKVEVMNGFAFKECQFVNSANKRDSSAPWTRLPPKISLQGIKPDFGQDSDAFFDSQHLENQVCQISYIPLVANQAGVNAHLSNEIL
jgi:hypothetical protein